MAKTISNFAAIIVLGVSVLGGIIGAVIQFASGKEPEANIANRMNEARFLEEC